MAVNFGYWMMNFYTKYMPANIFIVSLVFSVAESVSNVAAHFVKKKLSARVGFIICFLSSTVAAVLLLLA